MSRRANILRAVRALVPSDWGDAKFSTIVHGSYAPGYGTTCGYLPIVCLYLAGCRDSRVLNYSAPSDGLSYAVGQNLSKLVFGGRAAGAFHEGPAGIRAGDVYYVSSGSPSSEHVGVYLGTTASGWRTADAGQTNDRGAQCARERERAVSGGRFADGRTIIGYLDVDKLSYSAAPSGVAAGGGGGLWALAALAAAGLWWKARR